MRSSVPSTTWLLPARLAAAAAVALAIGWDGGAAAMAARGATAATTATAAATTARAADPLAADAAGWSALLHARAAADPAWAAIERSARPGLDGVTEALHAGRRPLALWRLAAVRVEIAAAAWRIERAAAVGDDLDRFAAEWRRMGPRLGGPDAFAGVHPALARAIGEAALPQARELYQASLPYGRATTVQEGLLYLSDALAHRQLADFCRTVGGGFAPLPGPPLRPLDGELAALETAVQAAFHPPASIARHGDFVGTSELLKEARELNAAGLRHGALLRYLQAALAARPVLAAPPAADLEPGAVARRLAELDRALAAPAVDHSIGRLFLEMAQAHMAARRGAPGVDVNVAVAAAIAGNVLPRYLAALAPAARRRAAPPSPPGTTPTRGAAVVVTLVRWPYT